MKFHYEAGMRIRNRAKQEEKGTVTEDGDTYEQEVRVMWDGDKGPRWEETRFIMPDDDAAIQQLADASKQVQSKIDEATSHLEKAFKAWQEAASLEAGRECGNAEAYVLNDNPDLDLTKFEEVIRDNGWSTSSLYC
jgi:hypothetical protein